MLHRFSIVALLIASGCTDGSPQEASLEQAATTCSCEAPSVQDWLPERGDPQVLVPSGVKHLSWVFVPASDRSAVYAWGVSNGEVLWVYRVRQDDSLTFRVTLDKGIVDGTNSQDPLITSGGGGGVGGDGPVGPGPRGEPPYSQAYVRRIIVTAQAYEDATEMAMNKLGSL